MSRALVSRLKRSRVRLPAVSLSCSNLGHGQVTHTHALKCHKTVMPYGWEGNRRFSVAMAMRHRFKWFILPTGSKPKEEVVGQMVRCIFTYILEVTLRRARLVLGWVTVFE